MTLQIVKPADHIAPIETIAVHEGVYRTPFLRVDSHEVRWPDGRPGEYSTVISGSGHGAVVIPFSIIRGLGYFNLVRQFRLPLKQVTVEFPRGGIADGGSSESHEEGASRELLEETGAHSDRMQRLGTVHADTGMLDDDISVWLGLTNHANSAAVHHERDTGLKSFWVSEGQLSGMISRGEVSCGITLAAYALFLTYRPQLGSLLVDM